MDLFSNLLASLSLLAEGLEEKMPFMIDLLLSKNSVWSGKKIEDEVRRKAAAASFIEALAGVDPTPQKKFINFIVKQAAMGNITDKNIGEDAHLIRQSINVFANKKRNWPGLNDLMQYKSWRDLQGHAAQYEKMQEENPDSTKSKNQVRREIKAEGYDVVFDQPVTVNSPEGPISAQFKIYKTNNPVAATLLGKGTHWCTSGSPYREWSLVKSDYRYKDKTPEDAANQITKAFSDFMTQHPSMKYFPFDNIEQVKQEAIDGITNNGKVPNENFLSALSMAQSYAGNSCLYIIFKDGKPYMQGEPKGGQVKNTDDVELNKVGKLTAMALIGWIKSDKTIPTGLRNRFIEVITNSRTKAVSPG